MLGLRETLFAVLALATTGAPLLAQCRGAVAEGNVPPVVKDMSPDDPGFVVRYWAWDDFNRRRGGTSEPVLIDLGHDTLLRGFDWSDAQICLEPGPVSRTAVLFEALGPDGFGRWALVNLGADRSGTVAIDHRQRALGEVWSEARVVPSPKIDRLQVMSDVVEVELSWAIDPAAEALSDLVGRGAQPLPSVRGYAVYIINGTRPTSRPFDWSRGDDLEADAVNGFSTNTTATVELFRSTWERQSVAFAVALTYDGDGDAEGERPESRSIHGKYLGRPSDWLAMPPAGIDLPVGVSELRAAVVSDERLTIDFVAPAEPVGAAYRVWLHHPAGSRHFLTSFFAGQRSYRLDLLLPAWCRSSKFTVAVEMMDAQGRTVALEVTKPHR